MGEDTVQLLSRAGHPAECLCVPTPALCPVGGTEMLFEALQTWAPHDPLPWADPQWIPPHSHPGEPLESFLLSNASLLGWNNSKPPSGLSGLR